MARKETVKAVAEKVSVIKIGLLEIIPTGPPLSMTQFVKILFDGVEQKDVQSITLHGKAGEL